MQFTTRGAAAVNGAIDTGKSALQGWVRAGLAATAQGERLAFAHQQVAQIVSSLFLPIINRGTDALFRFADKLANSHAAEKFQDQMEKLADIGERLFELLGDRIIEGLGKFADILEDTIPAIQSTISAMEKFLSLPVVETINDWLPSIFSLSKYIGILADAWESGFDPEKFKELQAARAARPAAGSPGTIDRVGKAGGAMESITGTYQRLQQAVLRMETDYQKQTAENTAEMVSKFENFSKQLGRVNLGAGL